VPPHGKEEAEDRRSILIPLNIKTAHRLICSLSISLNPSSYLLISSHSFTNNPNSAL
jgi:hypothetical protein